MCHYCYNLLIVCILLSPDSVDTDEVDTNEQPSTTAGHYHHGRAGKRISKRGAQSPARSHHKMKG